MKQKNILVKPLITEKSMSETAANRYTFNVSRTSTKGQIKQAIEETFKVEVVKVNTTRKSGKRRRVGRLRREIKKPDAKKAIITVKEGQKIDIFESQG
jgi:large subunit ribosomal protein L23